MKFKLSGGNRNASCTLSEKWEGEILYAALHVVLAEEAVPEKIRVDFMVQGCGCYSVFSPSVRDFRGPGVNWRRQETHSRLAEWMPLHCLLSRDGRNRLNVTLSEVRLPVGIYTGIREETGELECTVEFFTQPTTPITEYQTIIRLDFRQLPYDQSVADSVRWWETACGYTPALSPERARMPMDSLWYSFHQELSAEEILEECALSRAMGMRTVIIDDGWQTADNSRGYDYCGDWQLCRAKIPDMQALVHRLHEMDMAVMLWYSVPFMGERSQNYHKFRDKMLHEGVLDPRYKEVREFLTDTYKRAVADWDLDGLKLDFIDAFTLGEEALKPDARRDYLSLEEAVDTLMQEVKRELTAIRPDILIEFRQAYVGPAIRQYGNMLRVSDCPADALRNRQDILNLRLTSGRTAVHSDMLMWNRGESPEAAAIQVLSCLFGVPQISVRLADLEDGIAEMLRFWLDFMRQHRTLLQTTVIHAKEPENLYPEVSVENETEEILVHYSAGRVIRPAAKKVISYFVNALHAQEQILILDPERAVSVTVKNCRGEVMETMEWNGGESLVRLSMPACGLCELRWR